MQRLDAALTQLDQHAWAAFASANAVRFTWQRLRALGKDARAFARTRIAAIGPATAEALADCGLIADLVPPRYDAAALATALVASGGTLRVLLPQADNARPDLRQALERGGCAVTAVTAYRSLPEPLVLDTEQPIDAVTFASSATVERFIAALGTEAIRTLTTNGCRFYAIGPQTAATMRAQSLPIAAMAEEATIAGLVAAVARDLAGRGEP